MSRIWSDSRCVVLMLAAATAAAHGWSLGDGLWIDDHLHIKNLRECGWTWGEMLRAAVIKPDEFIEQWWQTEDAKWQYARPASMLLLKLVYEATGYAPAAAHLTSIVLHLLTATLVWRVALRLTGSAQWSAIGGLLMVVYSHSVPTTAWIAAQNTILQTALMLGSLLMYFRATGLRTLPGEVADAQVPGMRWGWFAGAMVAWMLAVLARESAIVLPAILGSYELAFGGWSRVRARLGWFVLFAVVGGSYLVWRLGVYHHPIPEPYFHRPDDKSWYLAKLLGYLCSAVWLSPMTVGAGGRYSPFTEVPFDGALSATILLAMGWAYWAACRRIRGWWIWPVWLVLAFLPVLPILATPQNGYQAGPAFAIMMILAPGAGAAAGVSSRVSRWAPRVAVYFLCATTTYVPIYRGLWNAFRASETYTIACLTQDAPPDAETTDIHLLNVPFMNVYASLCAAEEWGEATRRVRFHALCYAPDLMMPEEPVEVVQIDAHRFSIAIADDRWFSGLLGRYLIDGLRGGRILQKGETIVGRGHRVTIADADPQGVNRLVFAFDRPLSDRRHRFYLCTPGCGAVRLRFEAPTTVIESRGAEPYHRPDAGGRLNAGESRAGAELLRLCASESDAERSAAWASLRPVGAAAAEALGSPHRAFFARSEPERSEVCSVLRWWNSAVDDGVLTTVWVRRSEYADLRDRREFLFRLKALATTIVATDLYMTGPPFPGPRGIPTAPSRRP